MHAGGENDEVERSFWVRSRLFFRNLCTVIQRRPPNFARMTKLPRIVSCVRSTARDLSPRLCVHYTSKCTCVYVCVCVCSLMKRIDKCRDCQSRSRYEIRSCGMNRPERSVHTYYSTHTILHTCNDK